MPSGEPLTPTPALWPASFHRGAEILVDATGGVTIGGVPVGQNRRHTRLAAQPYGVIPALDVALHDPAFADPDDRFAEWPLVLAGVLGAWFPRATLRRILIAGGDGPAAEQIHSDTAALAVLLHCAVRALRPGERVASEAVVAIARRPDLLELCAPLARAHVPALRERVFGDAAGTSALYVRGSGPLDAAAEADLLATVEARTRLAILEPRAGWLQQALALRGVGLLLGGPGADLTLAAWLPPDATVLEWEATERTRCFAGIAEARHGELAEADLAALLASALAPPPAADPVAPPSRTVAIPVADLAEAVAAVSRDPTPTYEVGQVDLDALEAHRTTLRERLAHVTLLPDALLLRPGAATHEGGLLVRRRGAALRIEIPAPLLGNVRALPIARMLREALLGEVAASASLFQCDDAAARDVRSVGLGRRRHGFSRVSLAPDPYFMLSLGYAQVRAAAAVGRLPLWRERHPGIVWRGASTFPRHRPDGSRLIAIEDIPRLRLCEALGRDPAADVGIVRIWGHTQLGQTATAALEARLRGAGLLRPPLTMTEHARFRLQLDIDGAANAWGFFEKLLLGSCILKVGSIFEQWFYHHLRPWTHYVPVRADLADLAERLDWCRTNDEEAASIGRAGQAFALDHTYEQACVALRHALAQAARPDPDGPWV